MINRNYNDILSHDIRLVAILVVNKQVLFYYKFSSLLLDDIISWGNCMESYFIQFYDPFYLTVHFLFELNDRS